MMNRVNYIIHKTIESDFQFQLKIRLVESIIFTGITRLVQMRGFMRFNQLNMIKSFVT